MNWLVAVVPLTVVRTAISCSRTLPSTMNSSGRQSAVYLASARRVRMLIGGPMRSDPEMVMPWGVRSTLTCSTPTAEPW